MNRARPVHHLAARLFGELVVIVVGVTLALWADAWASDRHDRQIEVARLTALGQNVERTLALAEQSRQDATAAAAALRAVLSYDLDRGVDPEAVRDDVLVGHFYAPAFSPELNVYDDLQSSGELALLSNPELRQALASMDAMIDDYFALQDDLVTVQQIDVDRFMLDHVDLAPLLGPYLGLPALASNPFDPGLTRDVAFRNLTLFKLDLVEQIENALGDVAARLRTVDRLIDEQLVD